MADSFADLFGGLLGDAPEDARVAGGVWAIVPVWGGSIGEADQQLLATARTQADWLGAQVTAVLVGTTSEECGASACHLGADRALLCDLPIPATQPHLPEEIASAAHALAAVAHERAPETILVRACGWGREVGARIAERTGGCYIGGAVRLEVETGARRLAAVCPILGGKLLEVRVADEARRPHLIALDPHGLGPAFTDASRAVVVETVTPARESAISEHV
jgi:electron transfer flavoprotein alpha subunit